MGGAFPQYRISKIDDATLLQYVKIILGVGDKKTNKQDCVQCRSHQNSRPQSMLPRPHYKM